MQDHGNELIPASKNEPEPRERPISGISPSPVASAVKKRPASIAKLEANRRNVRRSTGPKTARGKAHSRRNALKHGFLAKELLITGGEGMESRTEFEQLLQKTRDYFQPVGTPEELLVDQIVSGYWRLRRLHQHEVGEIRSRLDDASTVLTNEKLQRLEQCRSTLALQQRLATSDSNVSLLRGMAPVELDIIRQKFLTCTNGIDFLLQLLANASEEIAKTGSASVDLRWQLYLYFDFADPGIAQLSRIRSAESCQQPHSLHGPKIRHPGISPRRQTCSRESTLKRTHCSYAVQRSRKRRSRREAQILTGSVSRMLPRSNG
jgi:hypothetical protein